MATEAHCFVRRELLQVAEAHSFVRRELLTGRGCP
jgi:hypothetical protein